MTEERLFFNFVYYIEIEISSSCNRKCDYCPQSKVERKRELISIDIFEKIMKELQSINFDGGISFHQFNEPLLEYEHLYKCVECARRYLPNARLMLYTNGDLLTKERYLYLKKIGMDKFHITCQLDNGEEWSKELAYKKVKNMRKKLCKIFGNYVNNEHTVSYQTLKIKSFIFKLKEYGFIKLKKYPTIVQIDSTDFRKIGSSRLDIVKSNREKVIERNCTYFCSTLMHGMHISYKGNAYICCDCCEGTEEAIPYKLGSVYENTIFELLKKKGNFVHDYIEGETPRICVGCYWNQ